MTAGTASFELIQITSMFKCVNIVIWTQKMLFEVDEGELYITKEHKH